MNIPRPSTEAELTAWRHGPTTAERLCAGILSHEGFEEIDPQHPLGGPDGLKDILCIKSGRKYVAAIYFPPTQQSDAAIQQKFDHDLGGVQQNNAYGLIFMSNQHMTIGFRERLEKLGADRGTPCITYHLERIRAILDAPRGYGLRSEYLRIAMTPEETLAFFSIWGSRVETELRSQRKLLEGLNGKIEQLAGPNAELIGTISEFGSDVFNEKPLSPRPALVWSSDAGAAGEPLTSRLTTQLILFAHRATCADIAPTGEIGKLRTVPVWIGHTGASIESAVLVPPAVERIPELLEGLLARWNADFESIKTGTIEEKGRQIAAFHHEFVTIHPFLDGNGRVARLLMLQQAIDVVGPREVLYLGDRERYFNALRDADSGDLSALSKLVLTILKS